MFKRNNLAALAAFSAMMLPQPAFAAGCAKFLASSFWQGSCFLGSGVRRADVYLLWRRCGG